MRIFKYDDFVKESESPERLQENFLNTVCYESSSKWSIDTNGVVNIDGDFNAYGRSLKNLFGIKFGKVSGNFDIHDNDLESIEGSPKEVGGHFNCSANYLNSLKGGPERVGENYLCANNLLFNLEGIAKEFKSLNASGNSIDSLGELPKRINGFFLISNNKLLDSLEGSPEYVDGLFTCNRCNLETLEGGPKIVKGGYNCSNNSLQNLRGCADEIGGNFNATNNEIESLEGFPKKIGGDIELYGNNISMLYGLEGFKVNDGSETRFFSNLLPPTVLEDQLEYLQKNKNLEGWIENYIKKDNKFASYFNFNNPPQIIFSVISKLNLEDLSYKNPGIVYSLIKDLPENNALKLYLKKHINKFSPTFRKLGGMGLALKDFGF